MADIIIPRITKRLTEKEFRGLKKLEQRKYYAVSYQGPETNAQLLEIVRRDLECLHEEGLLIVPKVVCPRKKEKKK